MAEVDGEGRPITGSFMDYAVSRAADVPSFVTEHHPVPATTNPLGIKGCGEAGCAGAMVAVPNAIIDALSDYGIRHLDMPVTPEKVWRAVNAAGGCRMGRAKGGDFSRSRMSVAHRRPQRVERHRHLDVVSWPRT